MSIIVTARYTNKIDDRRKRRIEAVLERCSVRMPVLLTDEETGEGHGDWGDVEWKEYIDGIELEIFVGDGLERANRLAAELRACGMIVVMRTEPEDAAE